MESPTCGKCGKEMDPSNSKLAPEMFLCDECVLWERATPPPLTVETLELAAEAGCQNPKCNNPDCEAKKVFLMPACHKEGVDVWYEKGTKKLKLRCRTCKTMIVEVSVASHADRLPFTPFVAPSRG